MTRDEQLAEAQRRAILFRLPASRIYSLTGRDHLRYLHNRCTQEVKTLPVGESKGALILTPNGRPLGIFRLLRQPDSILLIVDDIAGEEESFVADLLRFKVADDVQLTLLDETHLLYTVQGPESATLLNLNIAPGGSSDWEEMLGWSLEHRRGAPAGIDIVIPRSVEGAFLGRITQLGIPLGDEQGREGLRVLGRIPKYGAEVSERIIATDLPLEPYVSFSKGCYTGQEVVEMSSARGRPNRELLVLECDNFSPAVGDEILAGDITVGSVTSVSTGPRNYLLAFVKLGVEAALNIRSNSGDTAPLTRR